MTLSARILSISVIAVLASCHTHQAPFEPVDYVNPLVGTMSKFSLSTGNTYPAIARPWGTHFWTPQTSPDNNSWTYTYSADKICGIKLTHQPSPWIGDYGDVSIMPVTTGPVYKDEERASWFSHKAETVTPYYYSVYLADHDTFLEMTPTEHAACFRVTYPEKDLSYLVVDAFMGASRVSVEGNKVCGYSVHNNGGVPDDFKMWFVFEFDTPFDYVQVTDSLHAHAIVGFKTSSGQQVSIRAAASFVSPEQALCNLSELDGKDFDTVREEGRDVWNRTLGRIEAAGGKFDDMRTFYSCLYRSVLFPRDLSEITADGRRIHRSPFDGQVHDGYLFADTGFWDTFRSLFSLIDLVYPEQAAKMQEGLANTYKESGFLPEWSSPGHRRCMVGNNSASVVAEALLKGLKGYDVETLWEAVNKGAHSVRTETNSTGRLGWEYYDSLGYVPCDVGIDESAARTLEYAYDDWCIWSMGKALGKPEEETAPYAAAALNYRNLFRPDAGMMSGRNRDGSFPENFNPFKWGGDFTEGNALQYSWSVFHDPAGLAELLGGKDSFAHALDTLFLMPPIYDDSYYGGIIHEIREMQIMNMGNYAHGNQPVQHVVYLYDWCGQPWKAQARVREVMRKFYTPNPDGYCGDEDNGQTSAWYVFSAMGFYPVCPASAQYAVGSPLFSKVTVHLPSGKKTVIRAKNNGDGQVFISDMKLNGRRWTRNYLTHKQLSSGADISFTMSAEPCMARGTDDGDAPYSFSEGGTPAKAASDAE